MRELLDSINQIFSRTGYFSNYKGVFGKIYGNSSQAHLAKEVIKNLSPKSNWRTTNLTELEVPLDQQENKQIRLTSNKEFGYGNPTISVDTLKKLAKSSRITVNENILPKKAFLKLQEQLSLLNIKHQDKRNLYDILIEANLLQDWKLSWQQLGFQSLKHFLAVSKMPIMLISSSICHSQKAHFFVEEYNQNGLAYNKIRDENLDQKTESVVISTPGINFRYSSLDSKSFRESGVAEICMTNMWENILESAMLQDCKYLSIPPIGLGAFLPKSNSEAKEIADLYFKTLFDLLSKERYKGKFDGIFYNAGLYNNQCKKMLLQYKSKIDCPVEVHSKDAKFLAINLSKNNHMCAVVNPSDMDVVLGLNDVGEYYKTGDYAMEEDIASTSTAFIGSREISGVYEDEHRISNSPGNNTHVDDVIDIVGKTFDNVTMYYSKPDPHPNIGIKFSCKSERDKFIKKMKMEEQRLGIGNLPMQVYPENPNVVYIKSNKIPFLPGTYKSQSSGCLAIKFSTLQHKKIFQETLNITKDHASENTDSLFFYQHVLPPWVNRQKNIKIQEKPNLLTENDLIQLQKIKKEINQSLVQLSKLGNRVDLIIQENTVEQTYGSSSNPVEELSLPKEFDVLYSLRNNIKKHIEKLQELQQLDTLNTLLAKNDIAKTQQYLNKCKKLEENISVYREIESLLNRVNACLKQIPENQDIRRDPIINSSTIIIENLENLKKTLWQENTSDNNLEIKSIKENILVFEQKIQEYKQLLIEETNNNELFLLRNDYKQAINKLSNLDKEIDLMIQNNTAHQSSPNLQTQSTKLSLPEKFNAIFGLKNTVKQKLERLTKLYQGGNLDKNLIDKELKNIQQISNTCQKLKKDISIYRKDDEPNQVKLSKLLNRINTEHKDYKKQALNSVYKSRQTLLRFNTIERVENIITKINNDKQYSSAEKIELIVGLLEINKDVVKYHQENTDILARFNMRGIKKNSRLVSAYQKILKDHTKGYKMDAVKAFNKKYPNDTVIELIKLKPR